jgi:hypothetical protein
MAQSEKDSDNEKLVKLKKQKEHVNTLFKDCVSQFAEVWNSEYRGYCWVSGWTCDILHQLLQH